MTMTDPTGLSTLRQHPLRAIVVGGSAGGIEAATVLLSALPRPLLVPVLLVLHIAASSRAQWPLVFRSSTAPVHEAEDKDVAEPGNVYVAPSGSTVTVEKYESRGYGTRVVDVNLDGRPVDALFHSAAVAAGSNGCGVILTGVGNDGAAGLRAMHVANGHTIAQDEATSLVYGMPRAALEAEAVAVEAPLDMIAKHILGWASWAQV